MNKKTITAIVVVAVVLVVIGVAYAALSATLNINGTTTVKKQSWKVEFTGVKSTPAAANGKGAQAVSDAVIGEDTTTMTWSTTLKLPKDYAEFVVAIENTGTIDAIIPTDTEDFVIGTAASSATNALAYEVCYVTDLNGTKYADINGAETSTCLEPKKGDIYYGKDNTDDTTTPKKLSKRYVKVKVFYDDQYITVDEHGNVVTPITAGSKDNAASDDTKTVIKLTTTFPFAQYDGA